MVAAAVGELVALESLAAAVAAAAAVGLLRVVSSAAASPAAALHLAAAARRSERLQPPRGGAPPRSAARRAHTGRSPEIRRSRASYRQYMRAGGRGVSPARRQQQPVRAEAGEGCACGGWWRLEGRCRWWEQSSLAHGASGWRQRLNPAATRREIGIARGRAWVGEWSRSHPSRPVRAGRTGSGGRRRRSKTPPRLWPLLWASGR